MAFFWKLTKKPTPDRINSRFNLLLNFPAIIAVRTGGHQYSGHSSTSGENIQVDVSRTFANESEDFIYEESSNLLKVGVSFSLLKMNTLMAARGMFVPTGICSHVHLGGHVQTGNVQGDPFG